MKLIVKYKDSLLSLLLIGGNQCVLLERNRHYKSGSTSGTTCLRTRPLSECE